MNAPERAKAVSAAEIMVRRVVREELRRCGLRPKPPDTLGVYQWDPLADDWVRVGVGSEPATP